MIEIDRQVFVTLNREGMMYYVLNDQNFVFRFFSTNQAKAKLIFKAWLKGDYRERYAVENGNANFNPDGFYGCIEFDIPNEPQSAANGAVFHIARNEWVN